MNELKMIRKKIKIKSGHDSLLKMAEYDWASRNKCFFSVEYTPQTVLGNNIVVNTFFSKVWTLYHEQNLAAE